MRLLFFSDNSLGDKVDTILIGKAKQFRVNIIVVLADEVGTPKLIIRIGKSERRPAGRFAHDLK